MKDQKGSTLTQILFYIVFIGAVAMLMGVGYTVSHFVIKFW